MPGSRSNASSQQRRHITSLKIGVGTATFCNRSSRQYQTLAISSRTSAASEALSA